MYNILFIRNKVLYKSQHDNRVFYRHSHITYKRSMSMRENFNSYVKHNKNRIFTVKFNSLEDIVNCIYTMSKDVNKADAISILPLRYQLSWREYNIVISKLISLGL